MTFARHLTLLLLASASLLATAQQPAPIVRVPPPQTPAQTSFPTPTATAPKPPAPTISPATAIAALSPGAFNRTVIVLDPAHGGGDTGSRINDQLVEKDITLAFAFRLRSLLTARGFTVVMTRDNDDANGPPTPPPSLDDRAGIANHARPVACLLLHATAAGSGVHLYTSELDATAGEAVPAPWLTAQAAWVGQSQRLANELGIAITRSKLPLATGRASIRPVDSLTCPALVVELAPNSTDSATLSDATYQQHVAEALANALVFWQNQAQPPTRLAPPPTTPDVPAPPTSEVKQP